MYDILFLGQDDAEWQRFKLYYPNAHRMPANSTWTDLKKHAFTKMFWVIWNDVEFKFNFNLNSYTVDSWDNMYVHIFKNGNTQDGICLFPKNLNPSSKEFNYRFFVKKKEIDIEASSPRPYDKFYINTYDDYLNANRQTTTRMFWAIWPEIEITETDIFKTHVIEKNVNHSWQHQFRQDKITHNGLHLMCVDKPVTKREIDYRFLINKKEHSRTVSKHKMYDIVFVSYQESNAESNFEILQKISPKVKRVHGVKGIHQAHIEAAKQVETEMFYVVDGDAKILENFKFDYVVDRYDLQTVHVWHSINPINNLVYGYGGVKLLPTKLTLELDVNSTDMTTSISKKFKSMSDVSNITAFNTDPFNTWKSAFRECAKLASKTIRGQNDKETKERLEIWRTKGKNKPFGKYAILGAKMGMEFGISNSNSIQLINNFDWLKEQFEKNNAR